MNQVALIGRIASDIQYIPCAKDRSVRRFAMAFHEKTKIDGEDDTYFIECEAWDQIGERIDKFVKKGSKIAIFGRLIQHKYKRVDGTNASKIVIVISSVEFLDPKKKEEEQPKKTEVDIEENDLPF